jgi:hypothetical protein
MLVLSKDSNTVSKVFIRGRKKDNVLDSEESSRLNSEELGENSPSLVINHWLAKNGCPRDAPAIVACDSRSWRWHRPSVSLGQFGAEKVWEFVFCCRSLH